jgi:hypothetical protein
MSLKVSLLLPSLFLLVFTTIPVLAQGNLLPDAPRPRDAVSTAPPVPKRGKRATIIEPGEKIPPLYVKDKLLFPVFQELRPSSWVGTFVSSGMEQLRDSDPRYGVDSGAYGQRLGAAAIRDLSMRTFSNGVLPALLHEDPRYYRMATGGIVHRGLYAASRVFVGQRDSGASGFNDSVIIGHGMAAALTMTYYPDKSANERVVFSTWGFSLLGQAGANLWSEFWPDTRDRFFGHRVHE